jgi:hypothetical protein
MKEYHEYPEYKYVEFSPERFLRNGNVQTVDGLNELIKPDMIDCCRTWAMYSHDLYSYCKSNKSISGYNGMVYPDFIPIDIDSMDISKVYAVINKFEEFDISVKNMEIYFSGNKGFHIEIPSRVFGIEPTTVRELYKRIKSLFIKIGIDCDYTMYNTHQLYRLPNTINGKSNLYKIPIKYSEINSDLKSLAKQPRYEFFQDKDVDVDDTLNALWLETPFYEITQEQAQENSDNIHNTTLGINTEKYDLKNSINGISRRNITASKLTQKFMMQGYDEMQAKEKLIDWNNSNNPPLDSKELDRTFKSNWRYKDTFTLGRTKNFRANLRNDIVYQEYLTKPDKEPLAIYNYLLFNLNDKDKDWIMYWGDIIKIKRNQIGLSNREVAEELNLKTKGGKNNYKKVINVVNDLVKKKRFTKDVIGIEPKKKRTILTWIHFDFTQ